jgi:hypothetical protein
MANELATTNVAATLLKERNQLSHLSAVRKEVATALAEAEHEGDSMVAAFVRAAGLQSLREAFTPALIAAVSQMAGHALTFKTDRDEVTPEGKAPYPPDVIRDCVIQALLEGVELQGNQFSILGGSCYLTQNGYIHKLKSHPAISDFGCTIGMPEDARPHGKQVLALMNCRAFAVVNGERVQVDAVKDGEFDNRIAATAFRGDVDALQGKATRRIYKRLWDQICGYENDLQEQPDEIEAHGTVIVQKTDADAPDAAPVDALPSADELGVTNTTDARKGHTRPKTTTTTAAPEVVAEPAKQSREPGDISESKKLIAKTFERIEKRAGENSEVAKMCRRLYVETRLTQFVEQLEKFVPMLDGDAKSHVTDLERRKIDEFSGRRLDELAPF